MALSRRQFFRRFWNTDEGTPARERTEHERHLRLAILESYVRTNLLPYDFGLTEAQYAELYEEVRLNLKATSDEDLFSSGIYQLLNVVVEGKIQPWREAQWPDSGASRLPGDPDTP